MCIIICKAFPLLIIAYKLDIQMKGNIFSNLMRLENKLHNLIASFAGPFVVKSRFFNFATIKTRRLQSKFIKSIMRWRARESEEKKKEGPRTHIIWTIIYHEYDWFVNFTCN